jgi:hypothetical protein
MIRIGWERFANALQLWVMADNEREMRKEKLIGRLRNLYLLEFINAFFLPFVFLINCNLRDEPVGLNSIIAMTLNGVLLLQGSYLWFEISRQLRITTTDSLTRTFKKLKLIDIILTIGTIIFTWIFPFKGNWDKYGTIAFLSLAILEYINYFEFQLMYDNKNDLNYLRRFGRLKKAKLRGLLT